MVDQEFLDSLVFRKARLSDAGKVGRLVRELAGDVSDAALRKRFRRIVLRPSYINFLFLHDGRPIALFLGREGYFLGADAPYLQGIGIVVDPEYQRQGMASALAQTYMMTLYPQSDYSQFWFITQQDHLHQFYESLGYEKTGVRFVLHQRGQGQPSLGRRMARKLGV